MGAVKAALGPFLARNPFPRGWTDGLFYREKMRAIHRIAPQRLEGRARVLDIGGGRSGLAALLYPGATVVTLDLDLSLRPREPDAGAPFVCGDARRLPFPDHAFDVVTLFDLIEHVEEDEAVAREAVRVTRPGGWILLSTPAADWRYPRYGFMRRFCPDERELMDDWGHVRRGYTPARLAELFQAEPEARASFTNALTAFFHDVAFSKLGARRRGLFYLAGAPAAALGYLAHRPTSPGAEVAAAWRTPT